MGPAGTTGEIDASQRRISFEKLVLKGWSTPVSRSSQWTVGTRRIDLVVEGRTRRLAVECDGERWHTPEQLNNDLERQAMLERLGWTFIRIRGSVFFRDEGSAMAPVLAKLNDLGIEPLGPGQIQDESHDKAPLVERIRRHAQALTAKWLAIER